MAATRGSSPAPSNRDISGDEGDAYDLRAMSAGPSGTGSSSYDESTGVRNPDKSMIIRRREANRLAAQRLRVRKKEYQDSLEDRVRQLEEERATLVHRLNEVEPRSSSQAYGWSSGPDRRGSWTGGESSGSRAPGNADTDLRVASLEAANRRLQEELKSVSEENERLQAKLEQWSRWERELATTARSPRPPSRLYSEPVGPLLWALHFTDFSHLDLFLVLVRPLSSLRRKPLPASSHLLYLQYQRYLLSLKGHPDCRHAYPILLLILGLLFLVETGRSQANQTHNRRAALTSRATPCDCHRYLLASMNRAVINNRLNRRGLVTILTRVHQRATKSLLALPQRAEGHFPLGLRFSNRQIRDGD